MLRTARLFITICCLKDPHHKRHAERVQAVALEIAKVLELSEKDQHLLEHAALLHDIGKAFVSEKILGKEGELTEQEWSLIKLHPSLAYEFLKHFAPEVAEAILHHHENWDGSGYPDGLKGEEIPLLARIIRIADSIDAGCSKRTYKEAKPFAVVCEEIQHGAGSFYDPEIVSVLGNGKKKSFQNSILHSFSRPFLFR